MEGSLVRSDRDLFSAGSLVRRCQQLTQWVKSASSLRKPRPELLRNLQPSPSAFDDTPQGTGTALIVGVGPGLGEAVAERFASAHMNVAVACRKAERLDKLAVSSNARRRTRLCLRRDRRTIVKELFGHVCHDFAVPDVVVYSIQGFARCAAIAVEAAAFEEYWRQNCLGAFLVAKEAATRMLERGSGTIILVGSSSGVSARENHLTLAVGKFGLRALSHVLSRELGGRGIHVAHLIIDADIKENDLFGPEVPQAEPAHLAELIHMLHRQPRSTWTSELDARPWNERFWEHC